MLRDYCASCADANNLRPEWWTSVDPLATQYQRRKKAKHVAADANVAELSVFDSASTPYYADCVKEALAKGALEVGSRGTNAIFCPSAQSDIGSKYMWGSFAQRQDAVLVVLTSDPARLHARPEAFSNYSQRRCVLCGRGLY
jgi:hypothetical protein